MSNLDNLDIDDSYLDALTLRDSSVPGYLAHRQEVRELVAPAKDQRILEVGCGTGPHLVELAESVGPSGTVVGVDRSEKALAVAAAHLSKKGVHFDFGVPTGPGVWLMNETVQSLPKIGKFDRILADRLFAHLVDPEPVMLDLAQRLTADGRMIATGLLNAATSVNLGDSDAQRALAAKVLSWRSERGTESAWVMSVLTSIGLRCGLSAIDVRSWVFDCRTLGQTRGHSPIEAYGQHCLKDGAITREECDLWENWLQSRDADGTFLVNFVIRADVFCLA